MSSIGGMSVPVLGDSCQYSAWSMKIKCVLEVEEVDEVVYGDTKEPDEALIALKQEGDQQATNKVNNFKKKDAKARMILTCAVDSKHTKIIEACKTARDIWKRLQDEHADTNPITIEALMSEYYSYRMDESKSVSEYISHIDSLIGKLEAAGKPQEKDAVLAKIVSGLPEEFSAMRRAWDMTPAQFKDKQLLITNLKKEEKNIKELLGEAKIARAAGKRDKNYKRRGQDKRDKKTGKCHCCNAADHWWRDCPDRSPDWRPPKSSNKKDRSSEDKPKSSSVERACMAASENDNKDEKDWYLDSGASSHMTSRFDWLDDYTPYSEGHPIRVGNGELVYARGKGTVLVVSQVKNQQFNIRFRNVQYVPGISDNLISIGAADEAGWDVKFSNGKVAMIDKGDVVIEGSRADVKLYKLDVKMPMKANLHRSIRTLEEWHKSLGHPNKQVVEEMAKSNCVSGMKIGNNALGIEGCGDCQEGKGKRTSHPSSKRERATQILERVHMDLVGPVTPTSIGGARHFLLMKDEYSSFMFVDFMATKAHVLPIVKSFVNNISIRMQTRVQCFRTDQGSEFTSSAMKNFCLQEGIMQDFSAVYTPEQNGEAERANRVVIEMARTNLRASGLELGLWAEAINYSVYSRNMIPSARSGNITPYERFFGRKPDLSHLIPFGQPAHALNASRNLSKFDSRTLEVFIVGYSSRINTYRCYKQETKEIMITCDVVPATHRAKTNNEPQAATTFLICGQQSPPSNDAGRSEPVEAAPAVGIADERDAATQQADVINTTNNQQSESAGSSTPPPDLPPRPPFMVQTPRRPEFASASVRDTQGMRHEHQDKSEPAPVPERDNQSPLRRQIVSSPTQQPTSEPLARPLVTTRQVPDASPDRRLPIDRGIRYPVLPSSQVSQPRSTIAQTPATSPRQSHVTRGQSTASQPPQQISPSSIVQSISNLVQRPKRNVQSKFMRNNAAIAECHEPTNFSDATNGPDAKEWQSAIDSELAAHDKNGTWQVVDKPDDCNEISAKWLFKLKHDGSHGSKRYKARLVARGFSQRKGQDYHEIFAPVVRIESIRLLFSLCVQLDLQYVQFDIATAFLNGKVDEELYLKPPEGLRVGKGKTLKLFKSLYGLKQAPRVWNNAFTDILKEYGMKRCYKDPCVFVKTKPDLIYVSIYVDDGLIFAKNKSVIQNVVDYLSQKLEVKVLDHNCYLGIEIDRLPDGSIFLHQTRYIKDVIVQSRMEDAKSVATPVELSHGLNRPELIHESPAADQVPYAEILGKLMYCAVRTRPDLAYAMSVLSKHTKDPRTAHWTALKRVLRYLKASPNQGLLYKKSGTLQLTCYADADHAGDQSNRRSTSGILVFINSAPVCYRAQQQSVASLSTAEAEYIAAASCVQELIWAKDFLRELEVIMDDNALLRCDNQSAIKLIKNPELHQRTKHIDIRYHFIRERYQDGYFNVEYVPTEEQLADLFTKSLTGQRHRSLSEGIGCVSGPTSERGC